MDGPTAVTLSVIRSVEPVPYSIAYSCQRVLHARRVAGDISDTLWLLEHPPVLTTGIRRNQSANILINPADHDIEVFETERGGEVTYHGPGQLVGYLFVDMEGHGFRVKEFVKKLEAGFIVWLRERYRIDARHDAEHTGVWVGMNKITAVGIALRQKVSFHGFAFNINTHLTHFNWIVPCGINDSARGITSLEKLLGKSLDVNEIALDLSRRIRESLGYDAGDFSIYTLPDELISELGGND